MLILMHIACSLGRIQQQSSCSCTKTLDPLQTLSLVAILLSLSNTCSAYHSIEEDSQRTANLIQEQQQSFEHRVCVRRRGSIQVKGKGPMMTYWICSEEDMISAASQEEESREQHDADVLLDVCWLLIPTSRMIDSLSWSTLYVYCLFALRRVNKHLSLFTGTLRADIYCSLLSVCS